MQQRKSLSQLAAEIERQEKEKRDFIVPSKMMETVIDREDNDRVKLQINSPRGAERFAINGLAHGQIASKLSIPKPYYDRMLEQEPDLLTANINTWLRKNGSLTPAPMPQHIGRGTRLTAQVKPKENNLIRVLDGNVRAFLSDAYRPIDNMVVAQSVLPILEKSGLAVSIKSAEITERRLYMQIVTPEIQAKVREDVIQAGVTISNSEVGCGSFWFANLLYFLSCLNGAIGSIDMRKYHVGKRLGDGEGVFNYSERSYMLDDAALISKIQDMTRESLKQLEFDRQIKMLTEATRREVEPAFLTTAVQELKKKYTFTDDEEQGILTRFINGKDFTQYGLSGAVTNLANDDTAVPDYDRVIELEKVGGEILTWGEKAWAAFQKAA